MSELGPIQYEHNEGSVFLGRDYGKQQNFSEKTAKDIDTVIRNIVDTESKRVHGIIKENVDLLKAIAERLLEKETIVREEIEEIARQFLKDPKIESEAAVPVDE